MKSIYTLAAAILLVFPESALTADRNAETDLALQAKSLVQLADGRLSHETASRLIDRPCGHQVDVIHAGMVSGAFNTLNGAFMAWDEYVGTVGQTQNYDDYLATGLWHTFYRKCLLKPKSTLVGAQLDELRELGIKYRG
jgi:hypothetical protein